jgi:hypothetical protein
MKIGVKSEHCGRTATSRESRQDDIRTRESYRAGTDRRKPAHAFDCNCQWTA